MNVTRPILVFRVFSVVPDLVSLIRGSFSKPCLSDLSKAQNVPSIAFEVMGSSCTFSQARTERTFHVPIVVPSFGFSMIVFAPVAHLSPLPWSLAVGRAVVVDQGLD